MTAGPRDVCEMSDQEWASLIDGAVEMLPASRAGSRAEQSPALRDAAPRASEQAITVCIADVQREHVQWLWDRRVPAGKITVLDGDPGLGKSTLTLELAARLSRGEAMPDHEGDLTAGGTVILSAEDGLGDTIKPRLMAAGADLDRIHAIISIGDRMPELVLDVEKIRDAVERVEAKLIIIDPLMAFLGSASNSWKGQDIRRALGPIAAMAEELGAAVVLVRHRRKSGGPAIYCGGGSIGIVGAARSGMLVARDPDDEDARVLASTKCNLGRPPVSLRFKLRSEGEVARVEWLGESVHTADDLVTATVAGSKENDEANSAVADAEGVLRQVLADGPMTTDDVRAACKEAAVSWTTARRAKAQLGVRSVRADYRGPWRWSLPAQGAQSQNDEHLGRDEGE